MIQKLQLPEPVITVIVVHVLLIRKGVSPVQHPPGPGTPSTKSVHCALTAVALQVQFPLM
jgi:hypothetical protein